MCLFTPQVTPRCVTVNKYSVFVCGRQVRSARRRESVKVACEKKKKKDTEIASRTFLKPIQTITGAQKDVKRVMNYKT